MDVQHDSEEVARAFGPYRLLPGRRLLLRGTEPVRIGSRVLEILVTLVESAGKTVGKRELIARVWPTMAVEEGALRVHVAALRKLLGGGRGIGRYIESVTGQGYRFVAPVNSPGDAAQHPDFARAAPDTDLHKLPVPLTRAIGRADIVSTLTSRLAHRRLVTIVGPGGVGKTTVAIESANQLRGVYPDGVRFVELASIAAPSGLPAAVAAALALDVRSTDTLAEIEEHLRHKRVLLVAMELGQRQLEMGPRSDRRRGPSGAALGNPRLRNGDRAEMPPPQPGLRGKMHEPADDRLSLQIVISVIVIALGSYRVVEALHDASRFRMPRLGSDVDQAFVLWEQPATALACQCGGSLGTGSTKSVPNRRLFQRRPATSTWASLCAKLLKELKFQSRTLRPQIPVGRPRLMWDMMWHQFHIALHMKTIQMTIDERLLRLVDKLSRARKTTRSAFIRGALEAEIRRQTIREEEARHTEGYARKPVAPGEFDVWLDEQDWGAA